MPPSLGEKSMEMSEAIHHGEGDSDASTLELETESEENISMQEKDNYINELQNNLESMKLKAEAEPNHTKVPAEYEKTLAMYVQNVDEMKSKVKQSDEEKKNLICERDQALEDLRNVESAFNDVQRKYERSKSVLSNLKANEEFLLRRDKQLVLKLQVCEKKSEVLKEKAQESLEHMHMDYENRIRDFESENTRLRAQFRKMEMKLESLESDAEQKAKENAQLSTLCDELINGQGVN